MTGMPNMEKEWFDPVPRDLVSIFYIIALIYIAIGLYILAKHFFLPCLDHIIVKTGATASVAGTLIYGGATSFLGFITATIGVFVDVPDNMSTSKIFGGHIYDLTLIVALSTLMVPASLLKPLLLRTFIRDAIFVAISTILIFSIFVDDNIDWYETLLLLELFFLYLLVVRLLRKFMSNKNIEIEAVRNPMETAQDNVEMQDNNSTKFTTGSLSLATTPDSSCSQTALHFISLPVKIVLKFTIPSPHWKCCEANWWAKLYPLTLTISFVWMGLLSYLIVMIAMDLGRLLGLPGLITGFLIGPVSLELMSSIILAKRGDISIAIHAILGRAIISQCLTFGIPMLLYTIIFGEQVKVNSSGGLYSLIVVMMAIIVLLLAVAISKGKLRKLWAIPPIILFVLHIFAAMALTYGWIQMPI